VIHVTVSTPTAARRVAWFTVCVFLAVMLLPITLAQALTWGSAKQEELYGEIIYSLEEADGIRVVTPWYTVTIPHEYAPEGVEISTFTELPSVLGEGSGGYHSHELGLSLVGIESFDVVCYDSSIYGREVEARSGVAPVEGFTTSDGLSVFVRCYPEAVPGGGWRMDALDDATARAQEYAAFVGPTLDPPAWACVGATCVSAAESGLYVLETPWYRLEIPAWHLADGWAASYRESLPPSFAGGTLGFFTHVVYVVLDNSALNHRFLVVCCVPESADMGRFSGAYQLWDTGVTTDDDLRVWVLAYYRSVDFDAAEAQWTAKTWSSFVKPAGGE